MTAAFAITRVTTRQLIGGKRIIWLGLLALAPAAIFGLVSTSISDSEVLEVFIGLGVVLSFIVVVPVISLVFAATALGQERRDHTLSFLVLRPLPRWTIAAAKTVGAFAAAYSVIGLGATALGVTYGVRAGDWGWLLPLLIATAIATAIYVAIFVPLGYASERATLIGLAFVFIFENGVVSALGGLAPYSPWRIGFSALVDLAPEQLEADLIDFATGTLDPALGSALFQAALYFVIGIAATTILLRRRDLM